MAVSYFSHVQFWVSQGNKWCDFCKIFISNNPTSIRNHELGTRHKENVGNRLNTMRQEKATKDKELKEAARALEQIEAVSAIILGYMLHISLPIYDKGFQFLITNDRTCGLNFDVSIYHPKEDTTVMKDM